MEHKTSGMEKYDLIVIGAGHAGCEAANIAGKRGSKVLMVTMDMTKIAQMSCNPAMGGVAKGQIIREIDVLGGGSGIVSDRSAIQFRMLNRSKGPAMWSPRTQNDRMEFSKHWRELLENNANVDFWQDMVTGIVVNKGKVEGVKTGMGLTIEAHSVVITSGTFMNGSIHIGEKQFGGGRMGERASTGITHDLVNIGFEAGRMKTGTPPRIDGRTIDYNVMEEQKGDEVPGKFSFFNTEPLSIQRSCYITYTNEDVHDTLREGFDRSPMFNGAIQGTGPRYCPSIEDKINRFAERSRHQLFIEPEGWNTVEVYVNGFSTSLPDEVQFKAIRKVKGLENAKIFRPGYAIEYDYFPPTQLKQTLETKLVENLYFAGQINGTTGYEEAACQGLIAGINASKKIQGEDPFILQRHEAYIGVLIDDLITKGTEEPYRMFTSRAEFRILMRQDNADIRLGERAYKEGLISAFQYGLIEQKEKNVKKIVEELGKLKFEPEKINPVLESRSTATLKEKTNALQLLKRPEISIQDLLINKGVNAIGKYRGEEQEQAEILVKYDTYIRREQEQVERMRKLENYRIPENIDYGKIPSISSEAKEKLKSTRPETVGQASRISGVSPSDVSILIVYLGK